MDDYQLQDDGTITQTITLSSDEVQSRLDAAQGFLDSAKARKQSFNDEMDAEIAGYQATVDLLSPVIAQVAEAAPAAAAVGP